MKSSQTKKASSSKSKCKTNAFQPPPCSNTVSWKDLYLKNELLCAINDLGFSVPSEIQAKVIPKISLGRNIMCQAKSGSGKTAIFIIGILNMMAL